MIATLMIDEKQKGDKERIESHLEDIIVDCPLGNTMIVRDYYTDSCREDSLDIYLEPLNYTENPMEYNVMLKPKSKRKIKNFFVSERSSCLDIISKHWWSDKYTRLIIRSQRKGDEE